MKRYAEILIFSTVAIGIHVAGFYTIPAEGIQAGGAGGEEAVSIQGANHQIEAMVQEWEKPPEPVVELDIKPSAAPVLDQVPTIAVPTSPTAALLLPSIIAPAAPRAEEPVKVQTETARPIPKAKPKKPKVVKKPARKKLVKKKNTSKATKAQTASARRKEQKSAGTGGSAFAGQGKAKVTTGVSNKQLADMKQVWGAKIRRRIERSKKYPRGTRKNGKVLIKLTIGQAGNLITYSLRKSSGTPKLDTAALQAISNVQKFPIAPKSLTGGSYVFTVPIYFKR